MLRQALTGALVATAAVAMAGSAAAGGNTGECWVVNGKTICRGEAQGTGHQQSPHQAAPPASGGQGRQAVSAVAPAVPRPAPVRGPSRPLTNAEQAANFRNCSGETGIVFCPGGTVGTPIPPGQGVVPGMRNVPARPGAPAAPAAPAKPPPPSPAQVAAIARAQLTIPKPTIGSAPCTAANCKGAVGVPVWLWTDPAMFKPTTQTATEGGVSVTVTAAATGVTWDMGDGQRVTCDGPGTKYDLRFGFTSSPTCGYKYVQNSLRRPGGRFPLTATASWAITFSGDFVGNDTVTTTSTVNVAIGEVQAIVER